MNKGKNAHLKSNIYLENKVQPLSKINLTFNDFFIQHMVLF